MPAHDVDLPDLVVHVVEYFVERHLVGVVIAGLLGKVAEFATQDADVGGVDVAVEDEVDLVAGDAFLGEVGYLAHRCEIVRFEDSHALAVGQPLPRPDLFPDRHEIGVRELNTFYFQ